MVGALASGETAAVRTNYEDDLRASGRLGRLARELGWREGLALGQLMLLYRATQDAGIIADDLEAILDCVEIEFETRDEARKFVDAMRVSRLASPTTDGEIEIHGNAKQLAERRWLDRTKTRRAKKGGQKRASSATRQEDGTFAPASNQLTIQRPSSDPADPSPVPAPVPSPSPSPKEERERARSLPPETDKLSEIVASQIPTEQAMRVFDAYQSAREKHRSIQRTLIPGSLDIGHCKTLLAMSGGDERVAIAIVRAFVKNHGPKNFWADRKWSLWILVEPKNYELCRGIAATNPQPRRARDDRSDDGQEQSAHHEND